MSGFGFYLDTPLPDLSAAYTPDDSQTYADSGDWGTQFSASANFHGVTVWQFNVDDVPAQLASISPGFVAHIDFHTLPRTVQELPAVTDDN